MASQQAPIRVKDGGNVKYQIFRQYPSGTLLE
jgi:hypothetical protein